MPITRTGMPRGYIPAEPAKLWGSVPVEEVEGHEPDPAYDVRSNEGLGFLPGTRSELLGRERARTFGAFVDSRPRSVGPTSNDDAEVGESPGFEFESLLPYLVLGGVFLFVMKR